MDKKKISEKVASLRLEEGTTIREFAKNHGISTNLAFRYENGDVDNPTYNAARKFCKTFNISKNEFAADYYYEDEKIKSLFINEENIISRLSRTENSDAKLIQKFYDRIKDKTGIHDLSIIEFSKIEQNKYSIWHQATCYTKDNDLFWIGPITYLLGDSAPILKQDFSSIISPINTICLLDSSKLPDNCKNYVFFIPSKECFNFISRFGYDQNTSKNNVIIYFVDRNVIKEKVVLFGKDFLEEK